MHRAIKKVAEDIQGLRFNTAIAELIKLNNEVTGMPSVPRALAENLTLMIAPFAPPLAEEVWERLGHTTSSPSTPGPSTTRPSWSRPSLSCRCRSTARSATRSASPPTADEATILQTAEAATASGRGSKARP
jgi:leucyl-tRNA synthetase